jgi:[ribosomal protein S5]-alanine N-acetyltransferase
MHAKSNFSIATFRTLITPMNIADHGFIMELVNTEGWIRFIGNRNVTTQKSAIEYLERILENPDITYWVVRLKESSTPIGVVTFIKREYLLHRVIGFAFLPQYS